MTRTPRWSWRMYRGARTSTREAKEIARANNDPSRNLFRLIRSKLRPMFPAGIPVAVDSSIPATFFLASTTVAAGFPSPTKEYATKAIALNAALIKHPQATFLMRVSGALMRDAGIDDGDVVLDVRALRPIHGSIIIAVVVGNFTCKRLHKRSGAIRLQAANPTYPDIVPKNGQTLNFWDAVTKVIKSFVA